MQVQGLRTSRFGRRLCEERGQACLTRFPQASDLQDSSHCPKPVPTCPGPQDGQRTGQSRSPSRPEPRATASMPHPAPPPLDPQSRAFSLHCAKHFSCLWPLIALRASCAHPSVCSRGCGWTGAHGALQVMPGELSSLAWPSTMHPQEILARGPFMTESSQGTPPMSLDEDLPRPPPGATAWTPPGREGSADAR